MRSLWTARPGPPSHVGGYRDCWTALIDTRAIGSTDAFDPIGVHVGQFVRFQHPLNLRPHAGEQRVKFPPPHVAETQMHHPRRGLSHDDALGKIRILGHNHQVPLPGEFQSLVAAEVTRLIYNERRSLLTSAATVLNEASGCPSNPSCHRHHRIMVPHQP